MTLNILSLRRLRAFSALLLIALIPSLLEPAAAATAGKDLVYIGTYTDHGSKGIYVYRFDAATGQVTSLGLAAESPQPSFLTVDPTGHFLYAVNELDTYKGQHTGAVSAFSIDAATGKLSPLNEVSSRDAGPAHITLMAIMGFVSWGLGLCTHRSRTTRWVSRTISVSV